MSELQAFGNVVPTGLAAWGPVLFVGLAGPVPHRPEDGKVLALLPHSAPFEIASGAPLVTDVELGFDRRLYALSQGISRCPTTPRTRARRHRRTAAASRA